MFFVFSIIFRVLQIFVKVIYDRFIQEFEREVGLGFCFVFYFIEKFFNLFFNIMLYFNEFLGKGSCQFEILLIDCCYYCMLNILVFYQKVNDFKMNLIICFLYFE